MIEEKPEYYVYVYIDPRNFQEFYYGKGKGSRKKAHLSEDSDSEKSTRIKEIKKLGLDPVIRVIAKDLKEQEAYLIEKTLLWKLRGQLTNKSSGHFANKFRPHDTLHEELASFDFRNGLYYVNVGECRYRCWEDCRKYGFLSAGQGKKYSDQLRTLEVGDIVVAYIIGYGYVGVGKITNPAVRVKEFSFNNKPLLLYPLQVRDIFENCDNDKSEYLVEVGWIKTVGRKKAKWKKKSGLYTPRSIKASLQGQTKTIKFLQKEFNLKFPI